MKKAYTLIIVCLIGFESFSQDLKTEKIININYGFEVKLNKGEDFGNFTTYNALNLFHNNIKLFSDTTNEYEITDKLYPIIHKLDVDNFEILLEVNDRPGKNFLMYLKIRNDKIIKKGKLPSFIAKAADLALNNTLEYAGFWGYSEIWGNHNELTDYNPIIYYKLTENGIKLDSALTMQKNASIYGRFMGFEDDTNKPVSVKTKKKFIKEIERIESIANKK